MNSKVLHFLEGFSVNEINDVLSKKDDVVYYTRYIPEKNEFHIVKHRDGDFVMTPFVSQLFNFYKKNESSENLLSDVKIKGNDNFVIITSSNIELITRLKNDLNVLLKK
jgi:hypothetical protein